MSFRNNCYAKLWNLDKEGNRAVIINEEKKYADIKVTTSKKVTPAVYETDFAAKVRCFGKAYEVLKANDLREKDRVKLIDVSVTNHFDKEKNIMLTNYICWDLELPEGSNVGAKKPTISEPKTNIFDADYNLDDLPF